MRALAKVRGLVISSVSRSPSIFSLSCIAAHPWLKNKRRISDAATAVAVDTVPLPPSTDRLHKVASNDGCPLEYQNVLRHIPDTLGSRAPLLDNHTNNHIIHPAIGPAELVSRRSVDTMARKIPKKRQPAKLAKEIDQPVAVKDLKDASVNTDVEHAPVAAISKKTTDLNGITADPEAEGGEEADHEEVNTAAARPPAVNSDYLPLPWKGRLGYACLCTYLRYSNPPVFSSRTARIASILEHRHPLRDPSQPEHPTKNRPDRTKPADVRLGQKFIESLCLANVQDMAKTLRWNDKYNIKFFRLSSEAFPFASHEEYGYKLAPFAADALAEVGKVAAELGHRVTTHPGQYTQLGSPRPQVIQNAIRDLEYHDEMLSLLKLPPQQDRDAIMVLHMGGVYGDKAATLARFRTNYARLSPSIKRRLVLENDDVSWSVHDLLPVCQDLNIPLVLDFHHHNIIFDATRVREGTADLTPPLLAAIRTTWTRKQITQKMHYSEPEPGAVTRRARRKHAPRVATLPPCAPDMDLMIEAKDKEQAVFELMRVFRLPGHAALNPMVPHARDDDNKSVRAALKAADKAHRSSSSGGGGGSSGTPRKRRGRQAEEAGSADDDDDDDDDGQGAAHLPRLIADEDVGMGGPLNRVYWPPTMEHWLRPEKRAAKKKEAGAAEPLTAVVAAADGGRPKGIRKSPTAGTAAGLKRKAASTSAPASVSAAAASEGGDAGAAGDALRGGEKAGRAKRPKRASRAVVEYAED